MGPDCPPRRRLVTSPAGPVSGEDRLGMRSRLEGAGLGLPLQGGAWGHDPGSRQPRREAAFREEAGENTHTQQLGEGGKKTDSRPQLARCSPAAFPGDRRRVAGGSPPGVPETLPSLGPGARRTWCWTWTGEGGWAWGAERPTALGEHGPSQVPQEGKLRHGRGQSG